MENLGNSSVVSITQPTTTGKPRVDLVKSDFDALITQKGYRVYHDKAVKCPCRNVSDGQGSSNCRNCGGSSWVFINRSETKMVMQSMNRDTKYVEWSAEKMGTAKITKRNEEDLGYMDRLTLIDVLALHSEVIYPNIHQDDDVLRGVVTYNIKEIQYIYSFIGTSERLRVLILGTDFFVENGNYIRFTEEFRDVDNFTVSIRYKHNPVYHVIDFTRGYMNTDAKNNETGGVDTNQEMPLSAVARLAHYMLDEQSYSNELLFNNTIEPICSTTRDINVGGVVRTVAVIATEERSQYQTKGTIIFNDTNSCWEGWNGVEWVAIDNKIVDLWESANW